MPMSIQGDLYTVEEAAVYLRLSVGSIRQYVTHGVLMPIRIGRSVFFDKAELDRYEAYRVPRGFSRTKNPERVA